MVRGRLSAPSRSPRAAVQAQLEDGSVAVGVGVSTACGASMYGGLTPLASGDLQQAVDALVLDGACRGTARGRGSRDGLRDALRSFGIIIQ